jgi:hypothetical protein
VNSYLKQAAKRGPSGHGKASEKKVAAKLGAKLTPNSGATKMHKGDMRRGRLLVEAKSTRHMSMKLEYAWLVKIAHEALNDRRMPAMTLSFVQDVNGTPRPMGEWALVPMYLLKELEA